MAELVTSADREALVGAVKLSPEAVDGLFPEQIKLMRQTVVDVNAALDVSGNALRSAMQDLVTLKSNVGHGNWRAFLKGGSLNISEKAASDLVNAYTKWIGTDEGKLVKDYVLSSMTPRTLSAVANSPTEVRNEVQSRVIGGGKVTEAEVRKLIGTSKRRTQEQKALTEANKDINDPKKAYATEETREDLKKTMKEMADNYQKTVKAAKAIETALAMLFEADLINTEDRLVKLYESKLKEQKSNKLLKGEVLEFIYKFKGMDIPEDMKKAKAMKKAFDIRYKELLKAKGVEISD